MPCSLDSVWPEVYSALVGYLQRRGATAAQAQDLAQEVAVKVLQRDVGFTSAQDLLRWCFPVARNALVDLQRATSRCAPVPVASGAAEHDIDVADVFDVHESVEARLRLQRVLVGIRQLSAHDQSALAPFLSDEGPVDPADRRESTRLAVRRHRARSRLAALVGPAAAVLGWVLGGRATRPAPRLVPVAAVAGVAMAVAVGLVPAPQARPVALLPVRGTAAEPPRSPAQHSVPAGLVVPAPVHARPAAERTAAAGSDEMTVALPVEGLVVRTGTRAQTARVLVCVAGAPGLDRTCLDRPVDVPDVAPPAEVGAQATAVTAPAG